jgi:hypothetical protein
VNTTEVIICGEVCATVLALAAMGRDMALKGLLKFSVGPAPVRKAPAATATVVPAASENPAAGTTGPRPVVQERAA